MKNTLLGLSLTLIFSCSVKEEKMIIVSKEYLPSVTSSGIGSNGTVTIISGREKFILLVRNNKGEILNEEVSDLEYSRVKKGDSINVKVFN